MGSFKGQKKGKYNLTPEAREAKAAFMMAINENFILNPEKKSAAGKKRWAGLTKARKKRIVNKMQKGLKKYHKTAHPDRKAAQYRAITAKQMEYYANMSDSDRTAMSIKRSTNKKKFYLTREGHITLQYLSYIMKFIHDHRTPEELERINKKRMGHRGASKIVALNMYKKRRNKRNKLIEDNLPRVHTFCGVITEKELIAANDY